MIDYDWFRFGVYALAVWRIAFMLVYDFGPWGIFWRLRERGGIMHDDAGEQVSAPVGSIFACVGCMAIWVSAVLWVVPEPIVALIAAAGVAKLLQRWYE